jgi:flagellar biogenesis protein FliO
MHTQSRFIIVLAALLGVPAAHAQAQLGPRPSEIPTQIQTQPSTPADTNEESSSQRARPVIDEMLFAQARSAEMQAASAAPTEVATREEPDQVLQRDLRGSETLPLVSVTEPATLVGAQAQEAQPTGLLALGDGWGQTIIALSGVLLLILGIAQFFKRLSRAQGGLVGQIGAGGTAPSGILEIIGRYPIGTGMTLVVMKFDRRILLVASGAATRGKHARGATMETLCELTDPEDVASVLLKARSANGETIARSFERALQEADDLTDESIYGYDEPVRGSSQVRFPQRQSEPVRTITTDEGDRAELWSSGTDGKAAANVLRRRLASMRRGEQQ